MNAAWLIGGVSLGLVSSLHCVGMCGPLALALPVQHLPKAARLFSLFCYNAGRILTYSLLGSIAGVAGRGIYLAGFQQRFSLTMGIIVLVLLVMYYGYRYAIQPRWMSGFFQLLQKWMLRILQSEKNAASFLLLGMANGLLPCGMVYVALATAITAVSVDESALFMVMFGIGTLPAMLALSYFGHLISLKIRYRLRQAIPVFIGVAGILLVIRGLNLNIPYMSPRLDEIGKEVLHCATVL